MRIVQSKVKVVSRTSQVWYAGAKACLVSNLNCIVDLIMSIYKWEIQFVYYIVGLAYMCRGRKKNTILHYTNCKVNKHVTKMFNLIQTK
jgi:hypothetical protein